MTYANHRLPLLQAPYHRRAHRLEARVLQPLAYLPLVGVRLLPARLAPGQEHDALVAQSVVHAAEGFVEDQQVGFLDESAEEEGETLRGEGESAE